MVGNNLAVNWGLNPGAGVKKHVFNRRKQRFYEKKFFEYYTAKILRFLASF